MLKAIKLRIYPNKTQMTTLAKLFGCCRVVYNECLNYKKEQYETLEKSTNLSDTSRYFHGHLRQTFEWLQEHNTKVLKQSLIDLEQAYSNFFDHGRGYPKYKSRHDKQSARFPKEAVSKNTFDVFSNRLNLTKTLKGLKFKASDRDIAYIRKHQAQIRSVTIVKKKCGHYYASILIDGDTLNKKVIPNTQKAIGIDLGIKSMLVGSDGTVIENPKWIRSNERQLKKLHKQLSKKKKDSNNRTKARLRLAKKHEKIRNQKQDFLHNLTSRLVSENQVICMEDLNVKGMLKNHHLAKAIQELSLHEFKRQLTYKSEWYGRDLVIIDRYFPSTQKCSCCGNVKTKKEKLKLHHREYECKNCGLVMDRDANAAQNILDEGLKLWATMPPAP